MDLLAVNAVSDIVKKPVKKLYNLQQNKPYPIVKARITTSDFGESVLLELEDCVVFLPRRVTETYKKYIDCFMTKQYKLVYTGLVDVGKPTPATNFKILE